MKHTSLLFVLFIALLASSHYGMARHGQYDEQAREAEKIEKELQKNNKARSNPAKEVASGVKEATYDSAKGLISETAESTSEEPPVVGTIEGARKGTGQVLDSTLKGAYKVATLGFGELESYEVVEPEAGTDETTKINIKF